MQQIAGGYPTAKCSLCNAHHNTEPYPTFDNPHTGCSWSPATATDGQLAKEVTADLKSRTAATCSLKHVQGVKTVSDGWPSSDAWLGIDQPHNMPASLIANQRTAYDVLLLLLSQAQHGTRNNTCHVEDPQGFHCNNHCTSFLSSK